MQAAVAVPCKHTAGIDLLRLYQSASIYSRNRMFVFVGGVSPDISSKAVDLACPVCSRPTTLEKQVNQVLSIFFIPLFTVHKGQPYRVCTGCGWDSRRDEGWEVTGHGSASPQSSSSSRTGQDAVPRGWLNPDSPAPSAPQLPLTCQQCGNPIQQSYLFCPFCGTFLKE